jgi:uncharacterized protein YcbK (DUF882 family)
MISRRGFIKTVIAGALSIYSSKKVSATMMENRYLSLYNIHTKENISIRYFEQGVYKPDALQKINYFLRCHFTNEVKEIDIKLLDLIFGIHKIFGFDKQIHVVSGYRSLEYNEYLRSLGRRVSKNSLHLLGLAADIFIPGISNHELYKAATSFEAGGVGHYSEFVHIDTGRKRYW